MLTQKQNGAEQPRKIKVILEADNRGKKKNTCSKKCLRKKALSLDRNHGSCPGDL